MKAVLAGEKNARLSASWATQGRSPRRLCAMSSADGGGNGAWLSGCTPSATWLAWRGKLCLLGGRRLGSMDSVSRLGWSRVEGRSGPMATAQICAEVGRNLRRRVRWEGRLVVWGPCGEQSFASHYKRSSALTCDPTANTCGIVSAGTLICEAGKTRGVSLPPRFSDRPGKALCRPTTSRKQNSAAQPHLRVVDDPDDIFKGREFPAAGQLAGFRDGHDPVHLRRSRHGAARLEGIRGYIAMHSYELITVHYNEDPAHLHQDVLLARRDHPAPQDSV